MRNILVVEDHHDHREWWKDNLIAIFPNSEVTAVATLLGAREVLRDQHFTLAILDINLPDGSGIDLLYEISAESPDTYSVICSIYDDDQHIFAALRAGAKGYLLKDQPREKQLEQLGEIVNGRPPLSPGVARRILNYFTMERHEPGGGNSHAVHLSNRESEVLTLIAKGYSRPEVAKLLEITLNTVSGYTKSIYQKLNITRRAEAVVEAIKLGLIDRDLS